MVIIRNHHKALYQTTSFLESVSEVFWTCLIDDDDKIQLFIGFRLRFFSADGRMVGFSSETAERGGWLCRISDTLSTRGDAKTEEPGLCQTKIPMEKQRWFRKTWMMVCLNEW